MTRLQSKSHIPASGVRTLETCVHDGSDRVPDCLLILLLLHSLSQPCRSTQLKCGGNPSSPAILPCHIHPKYLHNGRTRSERTALSRISVIFSRSSNSIISSRSANLPRGGPFLNSGPVPPPPPPPPSLLTSPRLVSQPTHIYLERSRFYALALSSPSKPLSHTPRPSVHPHANILSTYSPQPGAT
jgi:hypothetical protein